jgi:hypothetical protein
LSRQLVVALPLALVFLHHHLVNSLRQLVVTSPLLVLLLRPAPPSRLLVESAGCCRPLVVSSSRRLVVSSSRRASSCYLVTSAGCRAIISRRPLIAPPSRPLILLATCYVASPCAALLSSRCSPLLTPSNAVERCCRHRTPPPTSPLNTISIVHCCQSCHPSLPSNANAQLRRSSPSNADAHHRRPPPLMLISIVASSLPIHSPYRHCRRTLPPPLNAIIIIHRHWTPFSASTAADTTATGIVDRVTIVH